MSRKQVVTLAVVGVGIALLIVWGFLARQGAIPGLPGVGEREEETATSTPNPLEETGYTSEVPENAMLTAPKNEAPASANAELNTKLKFFDMSATRDGFIPSSFTVNKGDSLSLDFTAADGDYDLDIPYLGAYFPVTREGTTRKFPIDTSLPGTFVFQCRDHCPSNGVIRGSLIVLP